ncbi:hypothetical protein HETIRDRAFT_458578 [Heterobasidion irregulare TC 32-1]|uniref:Myb-like domain-containing protein n=1 Tax=Heterobasidion irregulare (strain TC 32-1) TaxID=747525 RepID=W4KD49_HETIT|nr:uncharacterized protein HETIRDRAFT_458578 [Heterobasidion irregulare TC 32-1]ETW83006.1 hypothetical protein HETIRDRAFT_458578 [Heterobasidion irregulare TC 32-1]
MDNPQHYQPLSHALHPPLVRQSRYSTFNASGQPYPANGTQREEEEEEEEDIVEEELDEQNHDASTPENRATTGPAASNQHSTDHAGTQAGASHSQFGANSNDPDSPQNKRRPGRPKGSRNRKPRESGGKPQHAFHNYPPPPAGAPTLPGVTPQNQQYYEFQWRVLNLCSEFYGAAEELVKATPSLVIAQSYQMGPSNKVDPLQMLGEAKRICDQLLQNPSQLVGHTPPPVYPTIPYAPPQQQPSTSAPAPTSAPSMITNAQSFVMPLALPQGPHPPPAMYPAVYATPQPSRYPTAPYYQYGPGPGGYYAAPPPQPQLQLQPQPQPQQPTTTPSAPQYATPNPGGMTATINMNTANVGSASGAWAEEETERLKKLAEQSRTSGTSAEIDWDWVVNQWGNTRTRHQILLKATSLGLKESTTRGNKRRREPEATPGASGETASPRPAAPNPPTSTTGAATTLTASPAQSHASTSTPSAQQSPAIQNRPPSSQARPQSSASTPVTSRPTTASQSMPWPMPTVAATTSPVLTPSNAGQAEPQRPSYYRASKPSPHGNSSAGHPYMYQPNGAGSREARAQT